MLMRRNHEAKRETSAGAAPQPAATSAIAEAGTEARVAAPVASAARQSDSRSGQRRLIRAQLYDQIDAGKAAVMGREPLLQQIQTAIRHICDEQRLQLSRQEEDALAAEMLDEMTGIGPIQPLLADDTVNDILVNGARQVFVERFGKLELSPITFIDEEHVFNTAQRIAAAVGRRIDEASPMVDARLPDGSRVNVITYPLAIDGTTISIRKFMRRNLSLEMLAE
ncbi:ATPase, T2SS/T4P/T4SS family, partial [Lonsdalea britannica]|uniref:ATPase, T2SS/T4P/T4SS family n=1 Tax=Lonsdalea britannica TaxID=1082704 RepID=UPI0026EE7D40